MTLIAFAAFSFGQVKQSHKLKGDGQIFWSEDFDWQNPDDIKGWTAPEGWQFYDETAEDLGYNFYWSQDSIDNWYARRDGGFILHSTTAHNGWLALDLAKYNENFAEGDMPTVNSTFVLPTIDCSEHPSVIISFEQLFRYFRGTVILEMSVSNDGGGHWATWDLRMGTPYATNTNDVANDEVAVFTANISEVAANQPEVIIKVNWQLSIIYFWMLDDISLREGWDNDMQLLHTTLEYGNDNETNQGFGYMIPKTQAGMFHSFEASFVNFGDLTQNDVHVNVDILKNGVSQFTVNSPPESIDPLLDPDTVNFTETYTPTEYGHYSINFILEGAAADQSPIDNMNSYLFHVNDSIYSLSDETMEIWGGPFKHGYNSDHEGERKGIEFNPIADCEASSITMYIPKARVDADFRALLLEVTDTPDGGYEVEELIASEFVIVDSTILKNKWVTLPLEKDGEGEFMKAGHKYIAAIEFYIYIMQDEIEHFSEKGNMFFFGVDKSRPYADNKVWYWENDDAGWGAGNEANFMIRLNINNHENIIDGINNSSAGFSLGQNYPNPFSDVTEIDYELTSDSEVSFELIDMTGKKVKVIEEGFKSSGKHTVQLNVDNLRAGVYYYTIVGDNFSQTKKMVISR